MNPPLWLRRWLRFNAVGAIGIVVQLAALAILKGRMQMEYLPATALAVEIAVLHNFIWHERWTWAERTGGKGGVRLFRLRLLRFNLSTGAVSIAANLLSMRVLVGGLHMQYLLANMLSIVAASFANFLLSDLFVFRPPLSRSSLTSPTPSRRSGWCSRRSTPGSASRPTAR